MSVIAPPPATTDRSPEPGTTPPEVRRRVPWRVAARLARRDVGRHPGRTTLVAGLVALPLAVVTLWLVAFATQLQPTPPSDLGLPDGVEARVYWMGQPLLQLGPEPRGSELLGEPELPDLAWPDVEERLRTVLPEARLVATSACEPVYLADGGQGSACTLVAGGDEGAYLEGRAPRDASEAAAGSGSAQVGEEIAVVVNGAPRTLTVVGIYDGGPWQETGLRLGPGSDALTAPFTDGSIDVVGTPVTWDDVVRLNEVGFMVSSRAAMAENPDASRIPYLVQGYSEPSGGGLEDADVALLVLGVGATLLVLVLAVAPSQVVGVRRSTRTYALLAATGADARALRAVVLLGAALQGLVTAAVGIGFGLVAAFAISAMAPQALGGADQAIVVPWLQLLGLVVVAVATVVAAALVPARTAARTDVVRVLGGRRGEALGRRRTPVVGLVLTGAGLAGGAWAAVTLTPVAVLLALTSLVTGLLLCAGALVDLVAGRARRASLPVRLALRDAGRHRSRSVAAVAAVTAAAAALVGGALIMASYDAHTRAIAIVGAGDGAVVITAELDAGDIAAMLTDAGAAASEVDPGASVVTVTVPAIRVPGVDAPVPILGQAGWIEAVSAPEKVCPAFVGGEPEPAELDRLRQEDPRCAPRYTDIVFVGGSWPTEIFVDDGTWLAGSGLTGAFEDAARLREGRVLVRDDLPLRADGTVLLELHSTDDGDPDAAVLAPAAGAPSLARSGFAVIMPPGVAQELGLESVAAGLIIQASEESLREPVAKAVSGTLDGPAWVDVVDLGAKANPALAAILSVSALVLGVGTAGLVLLLVAGESRADLAVLSAVGAAPRTRRRLAAAQSGVLVGIGTALGVVVGSAVALAFVALSARRGDAVDPTWSLVVPWGQVALIVAFLPLGAWLTGWLSTRSRLPAPSDVR